MKAIKLRTEQLDNPLGIDITKPSLSWICQGGVKQTAYEIEAKADGTVIWNSGKVESDKMNAFLGTEAKDRQRVTWRVRLWDENGEAGDWSEEAFFEMGVLDQSVMDLLLDNTRVPQEREGDLISCRVCANGFLYNMVRAMVGTIVYAAEGKLSPADIPAILDSGNRTLAGPTVPPGGLYMTNLWYDEDVL